jgi:hypothetical protein
MANVRQNMCGGTSDDNDATSEIQEILDQVKITAINYKNHFY